MVPPQTDWAWFGAQPLSRLQEIGKRRVQPAWVRRAYRWLWERSGADAGWPEPSAAEPLGPPDDWYPVVAQQSDERPILGWLSVSLSAVPGPTPDNDAAKAAHEAALAMCAAWERVGGVRRYPTVHWHAQETITGPSAGLSGALACCHALLGADAPAAHRWAATGALTSDRLQTIDAGTVPAKATLAKEWGYTEFLVVDGQEGVPAYMDTASVPVGHEDAFAYLMRMLCPDWSSDHIQDDAHTGTYVAAVMSWRARSTEAAHAFRSALQQEDVRELGEDLLEWHAPDRMVQLWGQLGPYRHDLALLAHKGPVVERSGRPIAGQAIAVLETLSGGLEPGHFLISGPLGHEIRQQPQAHEVRGVWWLLGSVALDHMSLAPIDILSWSVVDDRRHERPAQLPWESASDPVWLPGEGQRLPHHPDWCLQRQIGLGGGGEVWLGQSDSGALSAIKMCVDRQQRRRLRIEHCIVKEVQRRLGDRPGVAPIVQADIAGTPAWLRMAYFAGGNLKQWWTAAPDGPDETSRIQLLIAIAQALGLIHRTGVVHRDIKPSNILIDSHGVPAIADFGCAIIVDKDAFRTNDASVPVTQTISHMSAPLAGTVHYMAPEVLVGRTATAAADWWAFGLIAWQILVAAYVEDEPFTRMAPLGREFTADDDALNALLAQLLDGNPDTRLADANQVIQLLERLPQERQRHQRAKRRRAFTKQALVAAVVVSVLAAAALVVQQNWQPGQAKPADAKDPGKTLTTDTSRQPPADPPVTHSVTDVVTQPPADVPDAGELLPPPVRAEPVRDLARVFDPQGGVVLRHRDQVVRKERQPEPVPAVKVERPLVDAPRWATRSGTDQFGAWAEMAHDAFTVRLRRIEPGVGHLGSLHDERYRAAHAQDPVPDMGRFDNEHARLVVMTRPYWLSETEITQAQWQQLMQANPSHFVQPQRPVEHVSFQDAEAFCAALTAKVKHATVRLPTNAEWEYACRAGTSTDVYAGELIYLGPYAAPTLDAIAWHGGNSSWGWEGKNGVSTEGWAGKQIAFPHSVAGTWAVAQRVPNAWGLYDMIGNVWEWVADYPVDEDSVPVLIEPQMAPRGGRRIVRGGAWDRYARNCRAAQHLPVPAITRTNSIGFRICVPSQGEDARQIDGYSIQTHFENFNDRWLDQAMPVLEQLDKSAGPPTQAQRDQWVSLVDQLEKQRFHGVLPPWAEVLKRTVAYALKFPAAPQWAQGIHRDGHGWYAIMQVGTVQQRMRWIPPGEAVLGSGRLEMAQAHRMALHAHQVYDQEKRPDLAVFTGEMRRVYQQPHGFWLADSECSQGLWRAVVQSMPKGIYKDGKVMFDNPNKPLIYATLEEVQEFLKALSALMGTDIALPSADQWEYACRAGTTTPIYAGQLSFLGLANAPALNSIAWYRGNSGVGYKDSWFNDAKEFKERAYHFFRAGPRVVRTKLPNQWGLYDMLGNVREFTQSATSGKVLLMGGCWHDMVHWVRPGKHVTTSGELPTNNKGFRFGIFP